MKPENPKFDKAPKSFKGKRHSKSFSKEAKNDFKDLKLKKAENDPAWYFKYPELAKLAARIAFNHRNGAISDYHYGLVANTRNVDPILCYEYFLTPGISKNGDTGINITSYAAWKMLNRRFRGVSKYQQADFGIIQFGILDFMASLAEAERIYGIINYYSLNNKQLPHKLLIAMGVDPYSFVDLADYRLRLNKMLLNAKTLCLVKGYGLLDHAMLLASSVFKDKDNPRAQLFSFVKAGYWLYDPTVSTGSSLRFRRYATDTRLEFTNPGGTTVYAHLRTQDTILADLQYQLNALITDDDVDNVCSDILAFYGNKEDAAEVVTISLLPEDYTIQPVFSDSICRQVHNVTLICPDAHNGSAASVGNTQIDDFSTIKSTTVDTSGDLMVFQENNVIKFNVIHYAGTAYNNTSGLINFRAGTNSYPDLTFTKPVIDTDILAPSEEDVMEMTRLTFITDQQETVAISGQTCYYTEILTCGSVLPTKLICCLFSVNPIVYSAVTATGYSHTISQVGLVADDAGSGFGSYTLREAMIAKYDWAPIRYFSSGSIRELNADVDNYVGIDLNTLRQMHEVALISEFKNPISDFLIKE